VAKIPTYWIIMDSVGHVVTTDDIPQWPDDYPTEVLWATEVQAGQVAQQWKDIERSRISKLPAEKQPDLPIVSIFESKMTLTATI